MLFVCIAEPVPETRELLARLVTRRGDRPVLWLPHDGLGPDAPSSLDLLLFEPLSSLGRDARDYVAAIHADAIRVAVTAVQSVLPDDHGAHHVLQQPFAPDDLARVIDGAVPARHEAAADLASH
jgi:hypothetical protein